jgi:DNA-binding NtrC family response regulator
MAEKSRVLVVDDEEALRYLLSTELAAEGYEVETAGDGDEAIEAIKQNKPEIKVIMLTAYADVKNAIEALKLGASDFVSKPYDLEDILTSINRALGR